MEKEIESLYSRDEVARLLGICNRSVDALIKSGELASIKLGRRVLFSREAVRAFLNLKSATSSQKLQAA